MSNSEDYKLQPWPKALLWILASFCIVVIAIKYALPVGTPDLWWHMALGRHILDSGRLIVDHSIFTWTEAISYYVYNAWLSEVLLHFLYEATGPNGLIALRYLAYAGFFALAAHFSLRREIAGNPLAWVVILLGIVLAAPAYLVKPELFSFFFMYLSAWLYFSVRAAGPGAWRQWYWLPVIVVLWINSHGAFVLSSLFFLSIAAGEFLNARLSPTQAMPKKLRFHFFLALALCVPALLLSPFGYELPLQMLDRTITNAAEVYGWSTLLHAYEPTSAFNTVPFHLLDYFIAASTIFVFLIWQRLKNRQTDWVAIIAFLAYCWLFVQFIRAAYFFAPIFVFVCLDLLRKKEDSWAWPKKKAAKIAILAFSFVFGVAIGWRSVNGIVCHHSPSGTLAAGPSTMSAVPIEETDYIAQLPAVKRLGNLYPDGGYLMYRLWPETKLTIDPRQFPFKAWIDRYWRFVEGNDVQGFLDKYNANVWLINHHDSILFDWFAKSRDWRLAFFGPAGAVFSRAVVGPPVPPEVSANIGNTDDLKLLLETFKNAIAIRNWSLADRIRSGVLAMNGTSSCGNSILLAAEMNRTLTGLRAFHDGDYLTAATNLGKGHYLSTDHLAAVAMTALAEMAWNKNDYYRARTAAVSAFALSSGGVAAAYNAAIADWQYRRALSPGEPSRIRDKVTWQHLAGVIQARAAGSSPELIEVISSMQQGKLTDRPRFISPFVTPRSKTK